MRSEIAIYDLASGAAQSLLKTERLIEAPNWTPDGGSLVVNGEGHLYAVDLKNPEIIKIDTGFVNRCNNDHGISPDGRMLVISDSFEAGGSRIYTLPFGGGAPTLVQGKSPSYWHGWSPDGKTLAYVAKRGSSFQIHTCPAGGGPELQVTRDFDHCDGPDYTPDGEWMWFNGEIKGSVQLWRIRPDGSTPQQMTNDERVNWFPHPSPDGQHIVYVAYENGTRGHPRDKNIELRLMPAGGGTPKTLLAAFGGQGTMNVPCWSPDSRRFAFVRYQAE